MTAPALHTQARALWHLELGYLTPDEEAQEHAYDDFEDPDGGICFNCGHIHDICECHVGEGCGRWRTGSLTSSCSKAGSEECDFECPYRATLRF